MSRGRKRRGTKSVKAQYSEEKKKKKKSLVKLEDSLLLTFPVFRKKARPAGLEGGEKKTTATCRRRKKKKGRKNPVEGSCSFYTYSKEGCVRSQKRKKKKRTGYGAPLPRGRKKKGREGGTDGEKFVPSITEKGPLNGGKEWNR